MDLRGYAITGAQLEQARDLACRGLLCYQPFIFSDALETGVGYEFVKPAEGAGLVYCVDPPVEYGTHASNRFLIDPALAAEFSACNQQLRTMCDGFVDEIESSLGPLTGLTCGDIGCNSGYFPISFAQRGARRVVGYDAVDYTPTFDLLNAICGTNAEFVRSAYDGPSATIPGVESFDVVTSIAVLVHLSDPLRHLAFLGSIARKALLVWTFTGGEQGDDTLTIRYDAVNRYYAESRFPYCFDLVAISPGLLRRSLELMGFTRIHRLGNPPGGMPAAWFEYNRGYLAIRP